MNAAAERQRRIAQLSAIYGEIETWVRDNDAVSRVIEAVNPLAEIVVVGEATGPSALRLSGVPYFGLDGTLGRTGKRLEAFLECFGFTLYPESKVTLKNQATIKAAFHRRTVYCTDICPEYPGSIYSSRNPGRPKSARPSQTRVRDALSRGFLSRELNVVHPKAILLLGSMAYTMFCRHVLGKEHVASLSYAIKDLPRHMSEHNGAAVVPFWHPSPASVAFERWKRTACGRTMANSAVGECIRNVTQ
jgi:uracil-DNA glycosylase